MADSGADRGPVALVVLVALAHFTSPDVRHICILVDDEMGPPDRPQKSVKFWIPKADDTTADADTRQVRSCNLQLYRS